MSTALSHPVHFKVYPYQLAFKFDAGTSRGVLKTKDTWLIKLESGGKVAWGEAGPLKGLSIDDVPTFQEEIEKKLQSWQSLQEVPDRLDAISQWAKEQVPDHLPAFRFAMETAFRDLFQGGIRKIFDTPFFSGAESIPINGLVWMGEEDFMAGQMEEKLKAGFSCIKMKIGAIDYDREMNLLHRLRKQFTANQLVLRVDANGAFAEDEAAEVLRDLKRLEIHSIEQPVKAGQWEAMARLCAQEITPIALDEELIGVMAASERELLMKTILPQFIILKPTLVGGFRIHWIGFLWQISIARVGG
ncbi:enolase C-terminal domain-like protein [Persicobacter sp. CCB-QB2]|uniref:enolase C-terminal domain-like protein n=1 Tax=Persicobacter sp. CCB-QB2 TaxID=1561025 RepID=UPI000A58D741